MPTFVLSNHYACWTSSSYAIHHYAHIFVHDKVLNPRNVEARLLASLDIARLLRALVKLHSPRWSLPRSRSHSRYCHIVRVSIIFHWLWAGEIFGYRNVRTWEWTVAKPIRSAFPLWPVYGLPMALLKGLWSRGNEGLIAPATIYYATRMVMFVLCFVLEDWAIHELVHSPRKRRDAVILVASSYVTWTFQTHTFSNSVETLVVLWCLVLMQRIAGTGSAPTSLSEEKGPGLSSDAVPRRLFIPSGLLLGFLVVFGFFNRITFPAFLLIPGTQLLPHLFKK